jgi:hypothetical protein
MVLSYIKRAMAQRSPRMPACFLQSWTLEILEGFTSDVWTFATNRLLVDGRVRHAQTNLKPFGPL